MKITRCSSNYRTAGQSGEQIQQLKLHYFAGGWLFGIIQSMSATQHLRIALILTEFPPSFGGMQTHAQHLARALHAQGHACTVYTYRADQAELQSEAATFDATCVHPVRRILSRIGFWHNHQLLLRELRDFSPDIVYASNVYYGLLARELDIPVICRSVGNDVQRPWISYPFRAGSRLVSHPQLERWLHRLYRRCNTPEWLEALMRQQRLLLMRRCTAGNALVLANSHYTRDLLLQNGLPGTRIRVLPGGVDTQRFACKAPPTGWRRQYGIPAQAFVLMTACRLVAKKGIDFLLGQIPSLLRLAPNLHLLVVGDGRERKRCEALVAQLGIANHVTFTGRIAQEAIQHAYAASDLFVLASRISVNRISGLADAETMGRVLCEANAAGLPLIASRSAGIPSVVEHENNGLLFQPDDASDFLACFARAYQDPALRQRLADAGRKRAEQEFDWSVLLAAHQQAFADVLAPHAATMVDTSCMPTDQTTYP